MAEDYLEHAVAPFGQAEPGRINGPAVMRQTAEWLLAQFPDLHMKIEAMVAEGDTVAVRVLSEGTNLGPLNGMMPPTGQAVRGPPEPLVPGCRRQTGRALGHPARTWWRCCSWACCSRQVGRRPSSSFVDRGQSCRSRKPPEP
jgi:hypothetical protein